MRVLAGVLVATLAGCPLAGQPSRAGAPNPPKLQQVSPDTPPYELATEFIREITELWRVQEKADSELAEDRKSPDSANRALLTTIRHSTRVSLALDLNISRLGKMKLTREPHQQTLPSLIELYKQKSRLHRDASDIAAAFISGPNPGVDYGQLAAKLPKITAMLDDVDHTLFQMSVLMFGALIDMKEDSQNRANHLLITREQRDMLVSRIDSAFGDKLETDKRYLVSSGWLIKGKLQEFKCSDEPWD